MIALALAIVVVAVLIVVALVMRIEDRRELERHTIEPEDCVHYWARILT